MNSSTSHEQPRAVSTVVAGTTRGEVPIDETWDLGDLYRDDAAWAQATAVLADQIPELGALQASVGRTAEDLLAALTANRHPRTSWRRPDHLGDVRVDDAGDV